VPTITRVYNNGSREASVFGTEIEAKEELDYSVHARFGCAHFLDGKLVSLGYLDENRCRSIEAELTDAPAAMKGGAAC
jgi:hypothetical protein